MSRPIRSQHGAAALVMTLLLLVAMLLGAGFANRWLVVEQRSGANQLHATAAFEAAEAGLEWAVAQLNAGQRSGADCRPSADPAATSFRSRHLAIAAANGRVTPTTWLQAGAPVALQAACVRVGNGWQCSCPAQGAPALAAPAGPAAAFLVQFIAHDRPGLVRIAATGCTRLAGACRPGSGRADAGIRLEATLGLAGGLRTPPAATLTLRGAFDAGAAAIGVHNADPATGLAIDAGGAITAPNARLGVPAGAPLAAALAGPDAALAALTAERFFARHFGLDRTTWARQPAVTRIACPADCGAALAAAIDAAAGDAALIHVDGDLALAGPLALGSAARPVVIVASGTARLDGAVALIGVLHAGALQWSNTAGGGAFVRGALLSEAGYRGDGTPQLVYDRGVLDRLTHAAGSFVRVPGSWRDF